MTRGTASLLLATVATLAAVPAHAIVAQVETFAILKNNNLSFLDEFSNGLTPAQETGWAVFGSIPAGSEANSVLTLDTANGAATKDALGRDRNAVVITRTTPNNAGGLTSDDAINITGVFSLVTPTGPLFNAYGVRVAESNVPSPARVAQMHVEYNPVSGAPTVRFLMQDFLAGTITSLGATALAPTAGADSILLSLNRRVGDNNFYGSFAYGAGGTFGTLTTFATGGAMFVNSNFVRGQMIAAAAPIPEASTWAMMGLGLAGIAALRRRQTKAD